MTQYDTQDFRLRPDVGVPLSAHFLPFPLPVAKTAGAAARSLKM
jgi:hypothetical protein